MIVLQWEYRICQARSCKAGVFLERKEAETWPGFLRKIPDKDPEPAAD
jgi:hypothetical protein